MRREYYCCISCVRKPDIEITQFLVSHCDPSKAPQAVGCSKAEALRESGGGKTALRRGVVSETKT
jgi:hypothetical protein